MNFTSPHSRSECIKRFRGAVGPAWKLNGQELVVGSTRLDTLYARKRVDYRNSFQTVLTVRLRPNGNGTHVSVSTGISGMVMAFMIVWFGFFIALGLGIAFSAEPGSAIYPGGFIAFGIGLVSAGRWVARGEAEFLTAFLVETLDLERLK